MVLGLSSNEIKVKVSGKDCVQTVSVEMPVSKVKEQIEEAYKYVQNRAKLPGFRPGKAPVELVRKNYQDAAYAQAEDTLIREGVTEAIKSKKINAVDTPVILSSEFNPEKAFHFEFKVEVAPTVKAVGYKGLKLNKTVKTVEEADVEKSLASIADMNARLVESKAEAVTNTLFVSISYEGFLDGAPIKGAKAENFLIDMSAPQAIQGLAEGLVGAKAGEKRDVEVTFPADSPAKELAGKKAVFKVEVKDLKEKQVPALDDDFAKDLGLQSAAELREKVKANMQRELDQAQRRDLENQITEGLLKENAFEVPPSQVARQVEHIGKTRKERLMRQGFPPAEVEKAVEGMKADLQVQAEKEVRLAYVLHAIAETEKIEATDQEISAKAAAIIESVDPAQRETVQKALAGDDYLDRMKSEIRESKLFDWLIAAAKVKETTGGDKA